MNHITALFSMEAVLVNVRKQMHIIDAECFQLQMSVSGPEFVKVQSEFTAKIPVVMVTDSQTGCRVVMTINGQPAALTSKLLQLYTLADQRVQKLTVALRCWARVSKASCMMRLADCMCLYVSVCVRVRVCVRARACVFTSMSVCLFSYLYNLCGCVCLSIHKVIFFSFFLSVCLHHVAWTAFWYFCMDVNADENMVA